MIAVVQMMMLTTTTTTTVFKFPKAMSITTCREMHDQWVPYVQTTPGNMGAHFCMERSAA